MLANEERYLIKAIRFLGHRIREKSIEKLAIEGKVEGKRDKEAEINLNGWLNISFCG